MDLKKHTHLLTVSRHHCPSQLLPEPSPSPQPKREGNIKDLVTEIHKFELVLICLILKGAEYICVCVCV